MIFFNNKIKETKYFMLDAPIDIEKYYIKKIIYKLISPFYKLRLNINHPEINNKKYYISICAIFKNEAPYLREWIEYHKIIGIEHFYLYNNFSEDNYNSVLLPYINNGIVTLIDWPVPQGQMAAYNDCVEKYSKETNWLTFIDLDEFIVPNENYKIKPILEKFEKRPIVIAYWKYFLTSGYIERDLSGLVIEDFYVCGKKYSVVGKIFFNTAYDWAKEDKHNQSMHSHWCKYHQKFLPPVNFFDKVSWGGVEFVSSDCHPVQINHYVTRSYNEYMKKLDRGDAYFAKNPRSEEYFYFHEHMSESADYKVRKYLLELKIKLRE